MHKSILLRIVVLLFVMATLIYLGVMAYLGTFTRYMADDYCETYSTLTYSPLGAVIIRYEEGQWRAANRFSNLLFVGVVESLLGKNNIEIVPVVLMFLWPLGLVFLVRQVRILAGIQWDIYMDVFWEQHWLSFPFWKRPIPIKHFTGVPAWQPTLCL